MKMKLGLDNGQKCSLRGIKDEYLPYLAGRNCAPSHVLLTRQVLDWAIQSGINDLRSDRLAAQVDSWIRNLKARKVSESGRVKRTTQTELSARTKNSYAARIKAAVTYAHRRRYIPNNPLAGIIEKAQEQKRFLDLAALTHAPVRIQKLVAEAEEAQGATLRELATKQASKDAPKG